MESWRPPHNSSYYQIVKLVEAVCKNTLDDLPSWQAAEMIAQCIQCLRLCGERIKLQYVTRDVLTQPFPFQEVWDRLGPAVYSFPVNSR